MNKQAFSANIFTNLRSLRFLYVESILRVNIQAHTVALSDHNHVRRVLAHHVRKTLAYAGKPGSLAIIFQSS